MRAREQMGRNNSRLGMKGVGIDLPQTVPALIAIPIARRSRKVSQGYFVVLKGI